MNVVEQNVELVRTQVAEKLGWQSIEYSKDSYLIGYPPGRRLFAVVPSYTRDIKGAWMVVDYLALHGIHTKVQVDSIGNTGRSCSVELEYHGRLLSRAQDRAVPLAICQAFLQISGDKLACTFLEPRP